MFFILFLLFLPGGTNAGKKKVFMCWSSYGKNSFGSSRTNTPLQFATHDSVTEQLKRGTK